jgi:hypothetical protein
VPSYTNIETSRVSNLILPAFATAFTGWVLLSLFITVVTHGIAFAYAAKIAFRLAELHYGSENPESADDAGFNEKHIAVRYGNMSSVMCRAQLEHVMTELSSPPLYPYHRYSTPLSLPFHRSF